MLAQVAEVDERQQPYRAVTALEADDGFYAGVVDHRLQVGGALGIGTCEIGLLAVGGMRPELNLQAPRFEALAHFCRVGLLRQFPRRGDDAHRVAGPQVGRADELRPGGWLCGVGVQCRGVSAPVACGVQIDALSVCRAAVARCTVSEGEGGVCRAGAIPMQENRTARSKGYFMLGLVLLYAVVCVVVLCVCRACCAGLHGRCRYLPECPSFRLPGELSLVPGQPFGQG